MVDGGRLPGSDCGEKSWLIRAKGCGDGDGSGDGGVDSFDGVDGDDDLAITTNIVVELILQLRLMTNYTRKSYTS